jgi:hypothetical protein
MASAQPREAVGLVIAAALAILDVQVSRAVRGIPTAVLQRITLSHRLTTCGAIGSELTVLTAPTLPTVCTISQRTGGGIAARVPALLHVHQYH